MKVERQLLVDLHDVIWGELESNPDRLARLRQQVERLLPELKSTDEDSNVVPIKQPADPERKSTGETDD